MYSPKLTYHISGEILVVFGMLLSHHLALIFTRNKSQGINEIKGIQAPELIDEPENTDEPK